MYFAVKNVVPISNYKLLTFDNGKKRQLDMNPYLEFGVFKILKNEKIFNGVKISFNTITWENNIDLEPEFLYKNSKTIN